MSAATQTPNPRRRPDLGVATLERIAVARMAAEIFAADMGRNDPESSVVFLADMGSNYIDRTVKESVRIAREIMNETRRQARKPGSRQ